MAEPAISPERSFLQAVFPDEPFRECLEALAEPGADAVLEELRRRIDAALGTLSYRERGILEMRYGLGDGHAYTLVESGYVFRLTRERIRQLQVKSLKKLRERAVDLRGFLGGLSSRGPNGLQQTRH